MKIVNLLSVMIALCAFRTAADSPQGSFPEPPNTANRLFYIQRSNNTDTIMYEANLLSDKRLNVESPINVYWIRYAQKGQKENLSALQWQLAYGYKHRLIHHEKSSVEVSLNAFKKRPLYVSYHEGKPVAITGISGQKSLLKKIFVQLEPSHGLIPKVRYLDLFGVDAVKEQPVFERIYID